MQSTNRAIPLPRPREGPNREPRVANFESYSELKQVVCKGRPFHSRQKAAAAHGLDWRSRTDSLWVDLFPSFWPRVQKNTPLIRERLPFLKSGRLERGPIALFGLYFDSITGRDLFALV